MKLYRTTRYSYLGYKMWIRLSDSRKRYATTASQVNTYANRGYVTLEEMEIDESQFKLVETGGRVPE